MDNPNKRVCATVIPASWPQFTGPAMTRDMTHDQAKRAWYAYIRRMNTVGPTPKVYK